MRKLFLLLVIPVLLLCSCADPYGTSAKLAQDVFVSVNQANTTVDNLQKQGIISPAEERNILDYTASVNTLDVVYLNCVVAAHTAGTAGGFTACAQTLAASMGNPSTLAALHISNAAHQGEVTAVAQGIVTLVTVTVTALGGK